MFSIVYVVIVVSLGNVANGVLAYTQYAFSETYNSSAERSSTDLIYMLVTIVATFLFFLMIGFYFTAVEYKASRAFHSKITRGVLHSPISFFDTNPAGKIITRFSQDPRTLDNFSTTLCLLTTKI